MRAIRAVAHFVYDFVVGDDWRIAVAVLVPLVIAAALTPVLPAAVLAPLAAVLLLAAFTLALRAGLRR